MQVQAGSQEVPSAEPQTGFRQVEGCGVGGGQASEGMAATLGSLDFILSLQFGAVMEQAAPVFQSTLLGEWLELGHRGSQGTGSMCALWGRGWGQAGWGAVSEAACAPP